MTGADYQLRHGLLGRVGTLWSRQVDATTRGRARAITENAGCAGLLRTVDTIAQHTTGNGRVLVDDIHFIFVDGEFAVLGRSQSDYIHVNSPAALAFKDPTADINPKPFRPPIACLNAEFLAVTAGIENILPAGYDWYLIPMPEGVTPVVIEGQGGRMLVSGIDFSAHRGFIATRLPPATTFPHGMVRIVSAYLELPQMHSFLLGAPTDRLCSKYLIEYAKKTQSLKAFRRAAAEFCGMFVFPAPDVILSITEIGAIAPPGGALPVVYVTASMGVLRIDYKHTRLVVGAVIPAGTVVAPSFYILTESTSSPVSIFDRARASNVVVALDGMLPVKGLTAPKDTNVILDYVTTDPISGKPHVRMHLGGDPAALAALWTRQRRHELSTGDFLYDEFFTDSQTTRTIPFGELVASYYGSQLSLLIYTDLNIKMESRLLQFVKEHKPAGCVMLTATKIRRAYRSPAANRYVSPAANQYVSPA